MISRLKKQNAKFTGLYNKERVYVQSGLTVTPSEMSTMADHGIPISAHIDESMFYDGDSKPLTDIDPLMMRGVDVVDAWNLEKSSRKNLKSALTKDIENYG